MFTKNGKLKSIVCNRGFGDDQYQIYKSMEGIYKLQE
jgi:hypothetical protein